MTTPPNPTSVSTDIDVEASPEHAFRVFTEGIGTWWDEGHHILQAPLAEMVFEPYAGGHIIDRGTDGSECRWARTHVVLTHRHLDRHGDGWEQMRAAVGSGWSLAGFAKAAGQPSLR